MTTNGTEEAVNKADRPAYAPIPDTLSAARRLAIVQGLIIVVMEEDERLTIMAQVMRRIGDDPALTEPHRKEMARYARMLREYKAEEARLLGELNGGPHTRG